MPKDRENDINIRRPWINPAQPGYVQFVIKSGENEQFIRLSRDAHWHLYSFLLRHAEVKESRQSTSEAPGDSTRGTHRTGDPMPGYGTTDEGDV